MTEIPTMECPECRGTGRVDDLPDAYYPCPQCSGTGRIPRRPLTPDEIAALPDGARVMVEWDDGGIAEYSVRRNGCTVEVWDASAGCDFRVGYASLCNRAWLAEEPS